MTARVILGAFLQVMEDGKCLGDLLETAVDVGRLAMVGEIAGCQALKGILDRLDIGVPLQLQHLVIVAFGGQGMLSLSALANRRAVKSVGSHSVRAIARDMAVENSPLTG